MSMNDNRVCSVCPAGSENYEVFTTRLRGKRVKRVQYDYRTPDGELFATVASSLTECRHRRDEWLSKREAAADKG